ncbi:restriction endonuclease (plasmid) [Priestia aryabhattai]
MESEKQELLNKIKILEEELNRVRRSKKYGLIWENHIEHLNQNAFPMLMEVKEREIYNGGGQHILIEGDNYHSLKSLLFTHKGKVDVIYIDPPYNTGNKDFIYNDKIIANEDHYKHSKWLSFMEKRLELSKDLLSESGAIFLSIDDNEYAQLKLLCDIIFGEHNFIASIIWQKKTSPQNDSKYFSANHEYILCYVKNKQGSKAWTRNLLPRTAEMNQRYTNIDNDPRGEWVAGDLSVKRKTEKDIYEIITPTGRVALPPKGRSWGVSKEKYKKLLDDNRIYFGKNGDGLPKLKRFLSEVQNGKVPLTIWLAEDVGTNNTAKRELKEILWDCNIAFDTPKPVSLLKNLLKISSRKNSVILDFFAGSGSTGQAVLELNEDDGGNRNFILCTNNENNICEEVTYERLKKVINGYKTSSGKIVESMLASLKYYKTIEVGNVENPTRRDIKEVVAYLEEIIKIKHSTYIIEKNNENFSVFSNHEQVTGIVKNIFEIREFKDKLKKHNKKKNVYIISNDDQTFKDITSEIRKEFNNITFYNVPVEIRQFFRRNLRRSRV